MKKRYIAVFPSPWLLTPEALKCAVEHHGMALVTFEIGFLHPDLPLFRRAHSIFPHHKGKTLKAIDDAFPIRYLSDAPLMRVVDADKLCIVVQ